MRRAEIAAGRRPACGPTPVFGKLALLCVLAACALAPLARSAAPRAGDAATAASLPEWPNRWQGRPLRPLALSEVEHRFAAHFPGRVARATDGEKLFVFRDIAAPTRMLHPAADCYRGLGYRILDARLERDPDDELWRCFEAVRGDRRLRVCERIVDAGGRSFTDASSWFWAARLGRSTGPWQAVTVARAL